jgi:uncharacterized membrane protein
VLSVLFAFTGSVVYGASDFFGGMAAKRISPVAVTAINSIVGVVLLLAATVIVPAAWSTGSVFWGALSGVAAAVALVLLYACLAIGPMSILVTIMALVSAVVPITVGFLRGERLSALGYTGLVLGLVAIILICLIPGMRVVRPTPRSILLAVGSGAGVGSYLVCIDLSPGDSGLTPLATCFAVTGLILWAILGVRRLRRRGGTSVAVDRRAVLFSLLCGLTDAMAATLFLLALRTGDLSIVSVLGALSPAGTILLASVVLRERVAAVQWFGLVLALAAAALLALA